MQDSLKRLPSITRIIKFNRKDTQKPGQVVKQHIEDAKQDMKREKEGRIIEYKP
tara:strand:+ start:395 stop:556 length:162 start_codon:yes stop_codon:yes gene_type:complete